MVIILDIIHSYASQISQKGEMRVWSRESNSCWPIAEKFVTVVTAVVFAIASVQWVDTAVVDTREQTLLETAQLGALGNAPGKIQENNDMLC